MKKFKYSIFLLLITMTTVPLFTSCEKDDGSAGIEKRMRNENNGCDEIRILRVDNAYYNQGYDYWDESYVDLGITLSNNFHLDGRSCDHKIVCIGSVGGLGRIKKIPESGWADEVAVQPGQGYIIRSKNRSGSGYSQWCKYARVYVEDWIEGTSGEILGATIRYQDNWKEDNEN